MFTLTTNFGPISLTQGLESVDTRFALVNGLCGNLAQAILELDDTREVYFVTTAKNEEELGEFAEAGIEEFLDNAVHVVVGSPTGYLDAYGVNETETIEEFYGHNLVRGTHSQLREYFVTDAYASQAAQYAKLAREALELEAADRSFAYDDYPS